MTTETNKQLVADLLQAFGRGEMDKVAACFASDAVWEFPGRSVLSGTFKGPDEIVGFLARAFELSGGTLSVDLIDLLASDWGGVQVQRVQAGSATSERRLDCVELLAHEIVDGKIVRTYHRSDTDEIEEFFGSA